MTSVPCTRGYVRDILDSKHLDPKVDQYSGRGDQSKGLSPSPLANPWKIGVHGDRDEVVETFTDFAHNNALIRLGARALGGRRLWCHCRPHGRRHGDVLAELHAREAQVRSSQRRAQGPWSPSTRGRPSTRPPSPCRPRLAPHGGEEGHGRAHRRRRGSLLPRQAARQGPEGRCAGVLSSRGGAPAGRSPPVVRGPGQRSQAGVVRIGGGPPCGQGRADTLGRGALERAARPRRRRPTSTSFGGEPDGRPRSGPWR